jgi:hypothetical protein
MIAPDERHAARTAAVQERAARIEAARLKLLAEHEAECPACRCTNRDREPEQHGYSPQCYAWLFKGGRAILHTRGPAGRTTVDRGDDA